MAEPTQIMFSYSEIVETLIKKHDLHSGIWMLSINFAMRATNVETAPSSNEHVPTAMVGIMGVGLHRTDRESNLALDAAKVNPATPVKHRPRR